MQHLPVHALGTPTQELNLGFGEAKVLHLPDWHKLSHPQRLAVLRNIAMSRGRDPRIARIAIRIIKKAKVKSRDYKGQAAALLKWVQDNIYFINEPGEKLQDPIRTLKDRSGDCDDLIMLLTCLFESVNLPWRFVLAGLRGDKKVRYIEGNQFPSWGSTVNWAHIYCIVGTPPFKPDTWYFCEPTVKGVPLGWDVVSGDRSYLPELMTRPARKPQIVKLGKAPKTFRAAQSYGDTRGLSSSGVVRRVQDQQTGSKPIDWKNMGVMVFTYATVSVTSALVLDWINGRGIWEKQGHVLRRVQQAAEPAQQSIFAGQSLL
jgi:hypothetical protein